MFDKNANRWKLLFFTTFALSIILSLIPFAGIALYPFKLFSTFIHESFHVLTSILTGGKDVSFLINQDTSGLTKHTGGFLPVIIPAGYIGTSFLGGALILINSKRYTEKFLFIVLGLYFIGMTFFFGLTSLLTITFGFGVGFLFIFLGITFKGNLPTFLLSFLSIQLSLNSLEDLKTLIFYSAVSDVKTDAQNMSKEVFPLPPLVWALIFALVAFILLYISISGAFKTKKAPQVKNTESAVIPPLPEERR